jgi:hypothetical protein
MPFCRKCGFEVSSWMSFCPKCGASLAPLTTQPRWYGYRFTSFHVLNAFFWIFLAFLWIIRFNAYGDVTWYTQFMWLAFGVAAGLVIGVAVTRRQLNTLTEKGEMGMSISHLLLIVGGILVLGGLFLAAGFVFPSLLQVMQVALFDSVLAAGISVLLTQTFLVVTWERNHKMRIYHKGLWSLKIYAVPTSISTPTNQPLAAKTQNNSPHMRLSKQRI